jgi:FemAB-related protein (PEP-CTERM system-associated)
MISRESVIAPARVEVHIHSVDDSWRWTPRIEDFLLNRWPVPLSQHPAWMSVLRRGQRHTPYCLEAVENDETRGFLSLCYVRSLLFGRFLVSLPYVNYGGVIADDDLVAKLLIDRAVELADQLKVRYLELRHETPIAHEALADRRTDKVQMRLSLPATTDELWDSLTAKVRNQVRKGEKNGLSVTWGGEELLPGFYSVFSENMRDLGTPVYGRRLFRTILEHFPERAEICLVRAFTQPIAAGLVLHGWGVSEVPSASSLRTFNYTCANMLMYWELLKRAIEHKQQSFDFGRASRNGSTFRFKKQWGAEPFPAEWQYYTRSGSIDSMRTENPRYQKAINVWQRLPLSLTRLIGPRIVRGIP